MAYRKAGWANFISEDSLFLSLAFHQHFGEYRQKQKTQ
jgi:hypothetical protein